MKLEHCSRASCVQIIEGLSDSTSRAINNALYWQSRCIELEEIIEMFCMDAAEQPSEPAQPVAQPNIQNQIVKDISRHEPCHTCANYQQGKLPGVRIHDETCYECRSYWGNKWEAA